MLKCPVKESLRISAGFLEESEEKELSTDPVEMKLDEFQESETELKAISAVERFEDEVLKKQAKEAGEPVNVQNVTLMEPLPSRQAGDVVKALDKLWAQFRAMGIPAFGYIAIVPRSCGHPKWRHGLQGTTCIKPRQVGMTLSPTDGSSRRFASGKEGFG